MANIDGMQNLNLSRLLIDSDEEQTEDEDDVADALSLASGTESDTSSSEDEGSMDSWSSGIGKYDRFTLSMRTTVDMMMSLVIENRSISSNYSQNDITDWSYLLAETTKYGNAKAAAVGKTFTETDNREVYKFLK
nr:unnamed protein product [Haemonchus contortus]